MSSDSSKCNRQDEDDVDFSDNGTNQNKIDEIKQRRKQELNKMRCKRYRERKKEIVNSQVYKGPICIVKEEELIKRRREYNKQKSKRYRDRRRLKMLSDGVKRKGREEGTSQNKINCQQYTEDNIEMFPSQVYKVPIHIIKEEVECHSDKIRQSSHLYRDSQKLRMYLDAGLKKGQDGDERGDFFHDGASRNEIVEIKIEKGSPK